MAFTKFEKDMGIIIKLDDEPNDAGGMTADELKRKFDEAGQALKEYINETLLPELSGENGAANIGAKPFEGAPGTTVQEQIEQVSKRVEGVVLGQIPDHSITPVKLTGVMQSYHVSVAVEDWDENGEIRIPQNVHGLFNIGALSVQNPRVLKTTTTTNEVVGEDGETTTEEVTTQEYVSGTWWALSVSARIDPETEDIVIVSKDGAAAADMMLIAFPKEAKEA